MVEKVGAVSSNSLSQAFRYFGLNPNKPKDRDRLLELMARQLFGRQRGRPPGTVKLTVDWYLQLMRDSLEVDMACRLTQTKVAELLKEKFPKKYGHLTAEWLRQLLCRKAHQVLIDEARTNPLAQAIVAVACTRFG